MEEQDVDGTVTRIEGKPVEVHARLRETTGGGLSVRIVDSILGWEIPAEVAPTLLPFLAASDRRLDVDRASDPSKTLFNFTFVGTSGNREALLVEMGKSVAIAE